MSRHTRWGRGLRLTAPLAASVLLFCPGTALAQVVQGCQPTAYLDARNGTPDARTLTWDFSIIDSPMHCLKIQAGQAVTWNGPFDTHPLQAQGGDTPNPIGTHQVGETTTVSFNSVGTFGYHCLAHSTMVGAIQVVAATPAPAPAVSPLTVFWLGLVLVATGAVLLRRWRAQYT